MRHVVYGAFQKMTLSFYVPEHAGLFVTCLHVSGKLSTITSQLRNIPVATISVY